MHIGHELVEVGSALVLGRARLEEQVHQHGLASADVAVDIETLDPLMALAIAEQAVEQLLLALRTIADEPLLERSEGVGGALLRAITLDLAGRDELLILGEKRSRAPLHGP